MALFLLWSIPVIGLAIFLYLAAYYSIYLRKVRNKKQMRKGSKKVKENSLESNSFQVSDHTT